MSLYRNEISRVTRSKEKAKSSYDKMSKWYDLIAGRTEKKFRDKGLETLDIKEGEIVLEIGFGTGHAILSMAQSVGDTGKVYGIDISDGMCNITGNRVKKAGMSQRVELICGDAVRLPYGKNFFDAIFLSFNLELFDTPEIPNVLLECKRVLQNKGRICIVGLSKKGRASIMLKFYEWAHKKFPNIADCRPIYVQEALEESGFEVLDITDMSMWGLPVEIVLAGK